jgi:hypothetical protein
MAQTGFTPISIYYSSTASATPTAGNLVDGELAINTADGKLFYKDAAGAVQTIASKSTANAGGASGQVQYNSAGDLAGSAGFTYSTSSNSVSILANSTGNTSYLRVGNSADSINGYLFANGYSLGMVQENANDSSVLYFSTQNIERMRIPAAGGLQVVNSISVGNATPTTVGAGVTFPTNQSASSNANTLDDYEEGTWTPTGIGQSFASATGKYTKIGRVVYLTWDVTWSATVSANQAGFSGFPFASDGSAFSYTRGTSGYSGSMVISSPGYAGTASGVLLYKFGNPPLLESEMSGLTLAGEGFYFV